MNLIAGYRDADFDLEKLDRTTSWPDGLQEARRFEPYLPRAVRHTNSTDNIERFKDHFLLAHKDHDGSFTWKQYLKPLLDDLQHFDTDISMKKVLLKRAPSPAVSELSNYHTASESDFFRSKVLRRKPKRRPFFVREVGGDAESISSMDTHSIISSNASIGPRKGFLKKMIAQIRKIADKTYKTVEKLPAKSEYCSVCGNSLSRVKAHKKCPVPLLDVIDCEVPLTPSMLKRTNLARMTSMSFDSPMKDANGSGEYPDNPPAKQLHESPEINGMKPLLY